MKVINLYGGAGAGKSTLASALFARLRMDNEHNCELVPEFAKDVVYDGNRKNLGDALYLLGNQHHRLARLKRHGIQLAICDSPLDMCVAYGTIANLPYLNELKGIVKTLKQGYTEFNVYVHRTVDGNFRKNKKWSTDIDNEILANINLDFTVEFNRQGEEMLYRGVKKWLRDMGD